MSLREPLSTTYQDQSERLDNVIDTALESKRIVGAVVLVSKNGNLLYQRAAGFANRESEIPMQIDSIFRLSSITKSIVTAAAMRLIEDGTLSLDEPVTRWLPDFKPYVADKTPVITIRHLLTHTSGLSYRFLEPNGSPYHQLQISDGIGEPGLELDENLKRLSMTPLAFLPGENWRYSLSLDVMGAVIGKIGGRGLEQAVNELVTAPLCMTDTDFSVTDRFRLVTPYADGETEPILMTDDIAVPFYAGVVRFAPSRILNSASYPSGGSGMAGTALDIFRFLEAVRKGGDKILREETVASMTSLQVGTWAETQGPGWGFGFGWAVLDTPALTGTPQSKGTFQWGGSYGHSWFVDPVEGLTVVALTNTAFEGMSGAFPVQIRNAVYE